MEITEVPLMSISARIIWKQGRNVHLLSELMVRGHIKFCPFYKPPGTLPNYNVVHLWELAQMLPISWRLNDFHEWMKLAVNPQELHWYQLMILTLPLWYNSNEYLTLLPPWGHESCIFNLLYLLWHLIHISNKSLINWTKSNASKIVSHSGTPAKTFV